MTKPKAAITGVHGYLPDYVLNNAELETMVDTNDEWIRTRTGISERRILKDPTKATSYMAAEAIRGLLAKTNTDPSEVDAVICGTVTPDMFFPSTATLACHEVGIKEVISFDVSAACSGFLFALTTGVQYIESGNFKKVIVVGADKMSSIVDYSDRATCIIFGDAGSAVMLEPTDGPNGIIDTIMKTDGMGGKYLHQKGGGSLNPSTHETVDKKMHYIFQDGKTVFKHAVKSMADVTEEIMVKNNLSGDDLHWLVPHQANKRIIDATARRANLTDEKVMVNIQRYGNTTAATIPLCLWDWEDKLKKGDNVILAAFGGGFTWGSVYLKWAY